MIRITTKNWHKNITGQKFGKLTAIKFIKREDKKTYWLLKCDCGSEVIKNIANLGKSVKSCGCMKKEQDVYNLNLNKSFTNGLYDHKLLGVWENIKDRCLNIKNHAYIDYGNRGITICEEWLNDDGFINFYNWAMDNGYKDGLSIDRINVDGNYEPSNCRWTTMKVQGNNRRNNTVVTINGETKNLGEWCKIFNINRKTVSTRIHRGSTPVEAIMYVKNKINKKEENIDV